MAYIVCNLSEGLRPSEVTVEVRDVKGRREYLRVPRYFVEEIQNKFYLPIGVVYHDRDKDLFLIEFSHEADSGANRIWVPGASIFIPRPRSEAIPS